MIYFLVLWIALALSAPVPNITISMPGSVLLGSTSSLSVAFDNAGTNAVTDVGFGPFIDVVATPAITSISSAISWNGLPLESTQIKFTTTGCISHPYMYADAPVTCASTPKLGCICANANDTLLSIRLPFSSFGIEAPPVALSIPITISSALTSGFAYASGGFLYGDRPILNSTVNPPIYVAGGTLQSSSWMSRASFTASLTITAFTNAYTDIVGWGIDKAFNFTTTTNTASNSTVSGATFTTTLPSNIGFGGLYLTDPVTGVLYLICVPPSQTTQPLGCVSYTTLCNGCITSISAPTNICYRTTMPPCTGGEGFYGGGQINVTFSSYSRPWSMYITGVPMGYNSTGGPFGAPNNIESLTSQATLVVSGATVTTGGSGSSSSYSFSSTSSLVRESLVIRKGASVLVSPNGYVPGAVLRYSLNVLLASNYSLIEIVVQDVLADGQLLVLNDATRPATISFAGGLSFTESLPGPFITVNDSRVGNDCCNDRTDGVVVTTFDVSGALAARNGRIDVAGPTTITISYFATIAESYTDNTVDNTPTGSKTVFGGDCINNQASVSSNLVNETTLSVFGPELAGPAAFQAGIVTGALSSSFYALNGILCSAQPTYCASRELPFNSRITLRINVAMIHNDFFNLRLKEAFPIPLFDISALTWPAGVSGGVDLNNAANQCSGSSVPALNRMCAFVPSNTLTAVRPAFSIITSSMTWQLDYGTLSSPASSVGDIDLLLTVELTSIPWIDNFRVVSLEDKSENEGSACVSRPTDFESFVTSNPKICLNNVVVGKRDRNGAVTMFDSTSRGFTFNAPRWNTALTINDASAGTLGTKSVTIEAGDVLLMMASLVNTGRGAAYAASFQLSTDITVDTSAPRNLLAYYGNGTLLNAADYSINASSSVYIDFIAGATSRSGDTSGRNVVLVFYEVTIANTFAVGLNAAPFASVELFAYTGADVNIVPYAINFIQLHDRGEYARSCADPDAISYTGVRPTVQRALIASSDNCTDPINIAVGESFRIDSTITLPKGTLTAARLSLGYRTTSPFTLLNMTLITVPSGVTFSNALAVGSAIPSTPITGSPVAAQSFNFGTIVTQRTATSTQVVVSSWWRPNPTIADATSVAFYQDFVYGSPAQTIVNDTTVTIRLNSLSIVGSTNVTLANPADENDIIRFCFNITQTRTNVACLYNINVTIPIPTSSFKLLGGGTVQTVTGLAVPGAVLDARESGNAVTLTVPSIGKTSPALQVCYNILYEVAVTGVTVATNATTCATTQPETNIGASGCASAIVNVLPQPNVAIAYSTSDTCTLLDIVRIGELVTINSTIWLPSGLTRALVVRLSWVSGAELSVVSHRIVSAGDCIDSNPKVKNVDGVPTSDQINWNFGSVTTSMSSTTSCSSIVVEGVFRVSLSAAGAITVTSSVFATGITTRTAVQVLNQRSPTLVATTSLTPNVGDAGDVVRYCITLTNSANNVCAYNVVGTVPVPADLSAAVNPLTFSFSQISPLAAAPVQCFNLTLRNTITTSATLNIVASTNYSTDESTFGLIQVVNATTVLTTPAPSGTASIVGTGNTCTTMGLTNSALLAVQAGETVTYRIAIRVPEGEADVLTLRMTLASARFVSASVVSAGGNLLPATLVNRAPTSVVEPIVTFALGNVTNLSDNLVNGDDLVTIEVVARIATTAVVGVVTPTIEILHLGGSVVVTAPSVEVIEPRLTISSTPSVSSAAWGDVVPWSINVNFASGSSRCAYNVRVCDLPIGVAYNLGSAAASGGGGATISISEANGGFCVDIPHLTAPLNITFNATMLNLPTGVNRCVADNVTSTSAPADGFVPRTVSTNGCITQAVLEALGDLVWLDTNGNGRQDATDTMLADVVVTLRARGSAVVLATTATNAVGVYEFNRFQHGIVAGQQYDISVEQRAGFLVTLVNAVADNIDSDARLTAGIVQIPGAFTSFQFSNLTYDFGFAPPIVIGDYVWRDTNGDGIQNEATAMAGIVVVLRTGAGVILSQTTTSSSGFFSFSSLDVASQDLLLPSTSYQLTIQLDNQTALVTTVGGRTTYLVPTLTGAGTAATNNDASLVGGNVARILYTTPPNYAVNETGLDFGLVNPPKLGTFVGDFVFLDTNNNGVQDVSDLPIAGVRVEVRTPAGALVAFTLTSATGLYSFTTFNISNFDAITNYVIQIPLNQTALAGRYMAPTDSGANDAVDSDGALLNGASALAIVTPVDGQSNMTYDFGFRDVALGGDVWRDTNGDGLQQGETTPIAGIVVTLYNASGAAIATTSTNAGGQYLFTSSVAPALVPGGSYTIGISTTTQPTLQPTLTDVGSMDAIDSDGTLLGGSTSSVRSGVVVAPLVGANLDTDFGLVPRFALGDRVWLDANGNGVQDAGESGVAGVAVQLFAPNGAVISATTSNATGFYMFDSLLPGRALPQSSPDYAIAINRSQVVLATLWPTLSKVAAASALTDSDGVLNATSALIAATSVTTPLYGVVDGQYDFGFVSITLGNRVWLDANANGLQDVGESGIASVVVELVDGVTGLVIATKTTDAAGLYAFNAVDGLRAASNVTVRVALNQTSLRGLVVAPPARGSDVAIDSDGIEDATTSSANFISGAWSSTNNNVDFGFQPLLSIGDFVWRDSNGDGRQSLGESGIAGVTVQLLGVGANSAFIVQTTTDASGFYEFNRRNFPGMSASTVYVVLIALGQTSIATLQPTLELQGGNITFDSNGNWDRSSAVLSTTITTPAYGSVDRTIDFGFTQTLAIGDFVWEDSNGNGAQDAGERALAGVVVQLYDGTVLVGSTTTNSQGLYSFSSATTSATMSPNSTLELRIALNQMPLNNVHGSLLPTTRTATTATLDSDAVLDVLNNVATIVNATTGNYGSNITTYDFGFVGPLVLGDFVWIDTNANGAQDAGEPGIANVTVQLLLNSAIVASTTTNATGYYRFSQRVAPTMTPSTQYMLRIAATQSSVSAYQATITKAAAPGIASDSDSSFNATSNSFDAPASTGVLGSAVLTFDFGFVRQLVLSGVFWRDLNFDGQRNEAPAQPIAGVVVELRNSANGIVATTLTASDGSYSFASGVTPTIVPLTPYYISVARNQTALVALHETTPNSGAELTDSDGIRLSATTTMVNVTTGAYGSLPLVNDFGYVQQIRIGDRVWFDTNDDGIQDVGERGLANVVVRLVRNGANVSTTTTDANGFYEFNSKSDTNVLPLTAYTVAVDALQSALLFMRFGVTRPLLPTLREVGGDRSIDSNGVSIAIAGNNQTSHAVANVTTPAYFAENLTIDFGWIEAKFTQLVVGDYVWIDANNDGIQQSNSFERPIANVTVQLRSATGAIIASTLTDRNGLYGFESVSTPAFVPITDFQITVPLNQPALANLGIAKSVIDGDIQSESDSNGVFDSVLNASKFAFRSHVEGANTTFDFGFIESRVGDFVWTDLNANGLQDVGEPAIANVRVELRNSSGALIASTLTNAAGLWSFSTRDNGLLPNVSYTIRLPLTGPLANMQPTIVTSSNATLNSNAVLDAARVNATFSFVAPPLGNTDVSLDAGFVTRFTIGNFIWLDSDGDGLQTVGEPGIAGVTLVLADAVTSAVLATTSTSATGEYLFDSLPTNMTPNTVYVITMNGSQSALAPLRETLASVVGSGANNASDSSVLRDSSGASIVYRMAVTSPNWGVQDLTFDGGFVRPFGLGDFVWVDSNADGVQTVGEPGIGGVNVTLWADSARTMFVASMLTNASGFYYFNSWEAGLSVSTNYVIAMQLNQPALVTYQPTENGIGGNGTRDSNGILEGTTFVVDAAVLTPRWGTERRDYDYGFVSRLTLGDRVWLDTNGNGAQDAGENGISGVVVALVDNSGNVVQFTTTNSNGIYQFDSLTHSLRPNETYFVSVRDAQAPIVGLQGTPTNRTTSALDSDGVFNAVRTAFETRVTIGAWGTNTTSIDFGFRPTMIIGDRVWLDADGDGLQGSATSEPGFANVVVQLVDRTTNSIIGSTLTDANGVYLFNSLAFPRMEPNTNYEVVVALSQPTSPTDATPRFAGYRLSPLRQGALRSNDSDATRNATANAAVVAARTPFYGANDTTFDVGFVPEITLSGAVLPAFANLTINLRAANGTIVASTRTDSQGRYVFASDLLSFTNYTITLALNQTPTYELQPNSPPTYNSTSGDLVLRVTSPQYGSSIINLDFPLVPQFNIGNYVWLDGNANARQGDALDRPLGGLIVVIFSGMLEVARTTTNATGFYLFNSLRHSLSPKLDYRISVPLNQSALVSLEPTLPVVGLDVNVDSNGRLAPTRDASIAVVTTPTFGVDDFSFDFGFVQQFNVGDRVWLDINGNGIQDASERGIAGVSISLVDADGTELAKTITDASGLYNFNSFASGLSPNTEYTLSIVMLQASLNGKQPTRFVAGNDTARDSNGARDSTTGESVLARFTTPPHGANDTTLDFGFVNELVIGDYVFFDADVNGLQSAGDSPIGGVAVELRLTTGELIATTLTNSTGYYQFTSADNGLAPRTSYVIVVPVQQQSLAGLEPTAPIVGLNRTIDSDGLLRDVSSDVVSLVTGDFGTVDLSFDFGFRRRIYVGDFVWHDLNADGNQGAGEPGIANVTVSLFSSTGTLLSTTKTDANGYYSFDSLTDGITPNVTYRIAVIDQPLLALLQVAPANAVSDSVDSDGVYDVISTSSIVNVVIGSWGLNMTTVADFGYVNQFNIGDFVWLDVDGDGVQEALEGGIEGVTLRLLSSANASLATTTTDAQGRWRFNSKVDDLTPASLYRIAIDLEQSALRRYQPTAALVGSSINDSNAKAVARAKDATWSFLTPAYGVDDFTLDAGFVARFSIGNFVWRDTNGDGLQSENETGIDNVVMDLHNSTSGVIVATTRTALDGSYLFDSFDDALIPLGNYVLTIDRASAALNGLTHAFANRGSNSSLDSNGVWRAPLAATLFTGSLGDSYVIDSFVGPNYGVADETRDFGFMPVVALGDFVWLDLDRVGVQLVGNPGIENVVVRLLFANGTAIATTATDSTGYYLFSSFAIDQLQSGGAYSLAVDWRQTSLTVTRGFFNGSSYIATTTNAGLNDSVDSDASLVTTNGANSSVIANVIVGAPGANNLTLDFGFQLPPPAGALIGNFLWIDANADGLQDAEEYALANVTVLLLSSAGVEIARSMTDANGQYKFVTIDDNFLPNINVSIVVPLNQSSLFGLAPTVANAQANSQNLRDSDGILSGVGANARLTINATVPDDGYEDRSFDFGFVQLRIGDYVWLDTNANGVQEANEPARSGVQIALTLPNGTTIATTTTDGAGNYYFTSNEHGLLPASDFVLVIDRTQASLFGYDASPATVTGSNITTSNDSNGVQSGNLVSAIVRTGAFGSTNLSFDFGFRRVLSIGDRVFVDSNGDGLQTVGEASLPGVLVRLLDSDGLSVAETRTNANGLYEFTAVEHGVLPDTAYTVTIASSELPARTPTFARVGANSSIDSDGKLNPALERVEASVTTGAYSTTDMSIDFGFTGILTIGDRVFFDANDNGRQDMSEIGLENVTVILFDSVQNEIARLQTIDNGFYSFDNVRHPLRASTNYTISVVGVSNTLQLSAANVVADDVDSDAIYVNGAVFMPVATGLYGSSNMTFDVGFAPQSSIGDFVWLDRNGNGVQDANEPALADVSVVLLDRNGSLVASTKTNADGLYLFNSLRDGFTSLTNYTIAVPSQTVLQELLPTRSFASTIALDSNGVLNSNGNIVYRFTSGVAGTHERDIDFGFVEIYGVRGRVWIDSNGDGIQGDAMLEAALADVVINLYAVGAPSTAAPIATTRTDANGNYAFDSRLTPAMLPNTTYELRSPLQQMTLEPYVVTPTQRGSNVTVDSNGAQRDGDSVAPVLVPTYGQFVQNIDFGFVPDLSIGDFVFEDVNGNGLQDATDAGIANVVVQLWTSEGMLVRTTQTNALGQYKFEYLDGVLPLRNYTLVVPLNSTINPALATMTATPSNVGVNDTVDSDGVLELARSVIRLTAPVFGVTELSFDFGFLQEVRIGDRVFADKNGNNVQDVSDVGLVNITVMLQDATGRVLASTLTNTNGTYEFRTTTTPTLLPLGNYFVVVPTNQSGLLGRTTALPSVGNAQDDSNGQYFAALNVSVGAFVAPMAGGRDFSIDFGFYDPLIIRSRVFYDATGDGRRDPNDIVVGNVTVQLIDALGNVIGTAITDMDGFVIFTSATNPSIVPGAYTLRVNATSQAPLTSYLPTTPLAPGVEPNRNSDGLPVLPFIAEARVNVSYVSSTEQADFGYQPRCASISGALYIDPNGNNRRDANEAALRGVLVALLLSNNNSVVATTATNADGLYAFGSTLLIPLDVSYVLRIEAIAGVRAASSAVASTTNETFTFVNVRANRCANEVRDVPYQANLPLNIGDFVFLDRNGNGKQDMSDSPLVGVEVRLYFANSTFVAKTLTDSLGRYLFNGSGDAGSTLLRYTQYTVLIDLDFPTIKSSLLYPTFANNEGVDDASDSDGVPRILTDATSGGQIRGVAVNVTTGDYGYVNNTLDFGLYNCVDTDVASGLPEALITFTGDAKLDFTKSNGAWLYFKDNPLLMDEEPDVGVPNQYPRGTISGWDLRGVYLAYSPGKDRLYVAFDCFGICGDADGDGDPGRISMVGIGAQDLPNLGDSETFTLMMDTNNDGAFDIIVGKPSSVVGCVTIDCIGAYVYDNRANLSPGYRYSGQRLNYDVKYHCNPSASCPDIEFSLDNWSKIPNLQTTPYEWRFGFQVFAGSFVDGGIGEDFMGSTQNLPARFLCPSQLNQTFNPFPPPTPAPAPTPMRAPTPAPVPLRDCCVVGATRGCLNAATMACVCTVNPFCCNFAWDAACVSSVNRLGCNVGSQATCPTVTSPTPAPVTTPTPPTPPTPTTTPTPTSSNACCAARSSARCGDAAIEQCVCAADNYCCSTLWDRTCALKVASLGCSTVCGAAPTTTTVAPPPTTVSLQPTTAPVDRTCTTCTGVGGNFGLPGSDQWCRCCGLNCGGFRADCIRVNSFCSSQYRCAATEWCVGVLTTLAPATTATATTTTRVSTATTALTTSTSTSTTRALTNATRTPTPTTSATTTIGSSPTTTIPSRVCVAGELGCRCAGSDATICARGAQCRDARCVVPSCAVDSIACQCALGSAGCACLVGDGGSASCASSELECSGASAARACVFVPRLQPNASSVVPCGTRDGDRDGTPDCADNELTLIDRTAPPTTVLLYGRNNATAVIGTLTVPSGGPKYADGVTLTRIGYVEELIENEASRVVTLSASDARASELFVNGASGSVLLCLTPKPLADGTFEATSLLCLASRAALTDAWQCEDRSLQVGQADGQRVLCGYTRSLGQLSLQRVRTTSSTLVGPSKLDDSSIVGTDWTWLYILLGVLALCCCCVLCIIIVLVRRDRRERAAPPAEREIELKDVNRDSGDMVNYPLHDDDDLPPTSAGRRRRSSGTGGGVDASAFAYESKADGGEGVVAPGHSADRPHGREATQLRRGGSHQRRRSSVASPRAQPSNLRLSNSGERSPPRRTSVIDEAIYRAMRDEN